jgi:hypothetical protein
MVASGKQPSLELMFKKERASARAQQERNRKISISTAPTVDGPARATGALGNVAKGKQVLVGHLQFLVPQIARFEPKWPHPTSKSRAGCNYFCSKTK